MIFRGNNYNEQFFAVAMLPLISIPLFWAVFSDESMIIGKIIAGLLGFTLLILPIRSFIFKRYEIVFENSHINVVYASKYVNNKTFYYNDLELVKFTNPPRGQNHIIIKFKGIEKSKKKFVIELENRDSIIPLIKYCKTQNSKTKYEAVPLHGELFNYIKKELRKNNT